MKTWMLLLLLPAAASAQVYDYTQTIQGTETVFSQGPGGVLDTSSNPFTVTLSGEVTQGQFGPEFSIDLGTLYSLPFGYNQGAAGDGYLSFTEPDGNGNQGFSLNMGPDGTSFQLARNCLIACTLWQAQTDATASWVDPPSVGVVATPEVSASGLPLGLTLILGVLAVACGKERSKSQ